jgi:hypothetical protein
MPRLAPVTMATRPDHPVHGCLPLPVEIPTGALAGRRQARTIRAIRERRMQYNRISADCHLDLPWMPPDLFTSMARAS